VALALVAVVVFVVVASLTVAAPVLDARVGGEHARSSLDEGMAHRAEAAVLCILFLVLGVDLIAKGLAPLTS